jgi:hypothetical protein
MKILATMLLVISLSGCSALSGFVMDTITGGSSGGINTEVELVVGDKSQVLGDNTKIEIEADKVDKVVGADDNSVVMDGAVENVEVITTNVNYPTWLIVSLLIGNLVFLWLPTPPTPSWKGFLNLFKRGK